MSKHHIKTLTSLFCMVNAENQKGGNMETLDKMIPYKMSVLLHSSQGLVMNEIHSSRNNKNSLCKFCTA